MTTTEQLQEAIARERAYQDAKWGTVQENPHSLAGWHAIAEKRLRKAIKSTDDDVAKAELLKMVAVGEACFEQWEHEMDSDELTDILRALDLVPRALPYRPLNDWLVDVIKTLFFEVQALGTGGQVNAAHIKFVELMCAGRAALLQHGIVERGEP